MKFSNRLRARNVLAFSIVVFLFLSAFSPMAQDPAGGVLDKILVIVASFATLAGVSALIGALVAFAQRLNWIPDDETAGKLTAGLNLVAFVILVALGVFRPDLSLDFLDSVAAQLATIALFVLGLITQLVTPAPIMRLFYHARVPVLGTIGERYEARAQFRGTFENWENPPRKG